MEGPSNSPSSNGRRRFALFGRKSNQYVVEGYEIGRIHTADEVLVTSGNAVAGDVIAESIVVEGQVFGNLLARTIQVKPGGIIWGDIFAQTIQIETGATLRGWMHTLDEATLVEYLNEGRPPAIQIDQPDIIPSELRESVQQQQSKIPPERISLLENLMAELATARLARFELEQSFENRLQAIAAERTAEAESLRGDVDVLQRERVANQQQLGELTANLQQKTESIDQLESLLVEKSELIDQQSADLESMQATEAEKLARRKRLEAENSRLSEDLTTMSNRAEELAERITSLEAALKASNQRAAEQEQALIHWQELSDFNEVAAQEAKDSLEDLQYAVKQNGLLAENLQQEKETLTNLYNDAQDKIKSLEEAAANVDEQLKLEERIQQLEEEIDRKTREVELNKQALVESTAVTSQANRKIGSLEEEINAYRALEEKREQWENRIYSLEDELEIANLKLAKGEKEKADQLESIESLAKKLAVQVENEAAVAEKFEDLQQQFDALREEKQSLSTEKEALGSYIETLSEESLAYKALLPQFSQMQDDHSRLEQDHEQLAAQFEQYKLEIEQTPAVVEPSKEEIEKIAQQIQQQHLQDIDYLNEQLQLQGEKLAQAQASLVESQLQADELGKSLKEKEKDYEKIRAGAIEHIRKLQSDLQHKDNQLNDLKKYLDRKKRRDRD